MHAQTRQFLTIAWTVPVRCLRSSDCQADCSTLWGRKHGSFWVQNGQCVCVRWSVLHGQRIVVGHGWNRVDWSADSFEICWTSAVDADSRAQHHNETPERNAFSTRVLFLRDVWSRKLNPLMGALKPQSKRPLHSNEGHGRAAAPPMPLLAVPNVTAHPSTASVPTSYYSVWHYNYLCTASSDYPCFLPVYRSADKMIFFWGGAHSPPKHPTRRRLRRLKYATGCVHFACGISRSSGEHHENPNTTCAITVEWLDTWSLDL